MKVDKKVEYQDQTVEMDMAIIPHHMVIVAQPVNVSLVLCNTNLDQDILIVIYPHLDQVFHVIKKDRLHTLSIRLPANLLWNCLLVNVYHHMEEYMIILLQRTSDNLRLLTLIRTIINLRLQLLILYQLYVPNVRLLFIIFSAQALQWMKSEDLLRPAALILVWVRHTLAINLL